MEEKAKKNTPEYLFILLIASAVLCTIVGAVVLVCVKPYGSYFDSDLIGAFWTLAGAFTFGAALLYQIREYKLQIIELTKSVQAQTDTSNALAQQTELMSEQKTIMLEQTSIDLLFNSIEKFNSFKSRSDVQDSIEAFYNSVRTKFIFKIERKRINQQDDDGFDINTLSKKLHNDIISSFDDSEYYMINLKGYVQYAINIFDFISVINLNDNTRNYFNVLFHNQFSKKEILVIYLSNLTPWGMPNSGAIHLNYYLLKDLLYILQLTFEFKIEGTNNLYEVLKYFKEMEYKDPFKPV